MDKKRFILTIVFFSISSVGACNSVLDSSSQISDNFLIRSSESTVLVAQNSIIKDSTDMQSELTQIWQLVINLEELQAFYHAELPERKPLRILKNELMALEPALVQFGMPVMFVAPKETQKGEAFLKFVKTEVAGDKANIEFKYPIEGVKGIVSLVKDKTGWKVQTKRIVEQ